VGGAQSEHRLSYLMRGGLSIAVADEGLDTKSVV
jgi:hypothetical protein